MVGATIAPKCSIRSRVMYSTFPPLLDHSLSRDGKLAHLSQNVPGSSSAVEPSRRWLAGTAVVYAAFPATAAAHDNPVETGELPVEPVPNPPADVFQRWHLEPRNLIQIIVIKFDAQLRDALLD